MFNFTEYSVMEMAVTSLGFWYEFKKIEEDYIPSYHNMDLSILRLNNDLLELFRILTRVRNNLSLVQYQASRILGEIIRVEKSADEFKLKVLFSNPFPRISPPIREVLDYVTSLNEVLLKYFTKPLEKDSPWEEKREIYRQLSYTIQQILLFLEIRSELSLRELALLRQKETNGPQYLHDMNNCTGLFDEPPIFFDDQTFPYVDVFKFFK